MATTELILRRRPSTAKCTIGELYDGGGTFICYTLEDVVREIVDTPVLTWKVKGQTAIPQGRYRVTITMSHRFKRMLPLLNKVPGFEGIRIHPGNTDADTEGCILPGMSVGPAEDSVLESRHAFKKVYDLIEAALRGGEVHIDVRNAHEAT